MLSRFILFLAPRNSNFGPVFMNFVIYSPKMPIKVWAFNHFDRRNTLLCAYVLEITIWGRVKKFWTGVLLLSKVSFFKRTRQTQKVLSFLCRPGPKWKRSEQSKDTLYYMGLQIDISNCQNSYLHFSSCNISTFVAFNSTAFSCIGLFSTCLESSNLPCLMPNGNAGGNTFRTWLGSTRCAGTS